LAGQTGFPGGRRFILLILYSRLKNYSGLWFQAAMHSSMDSS